MSVSLLHDLCTPCRIVLRADVWRASAILAGLRVAANDPIRADDRNRGAEKNWLADVFGTVGELVALRRVQELTDARVSHCPIAFDRSVDDVDMRVHCEDAELLLEAKAHFLQPGKSWFMVNARAHKRSQLRGAIGYLPVLTAMGARRALVGSLLTMEQLDAWEAPDRQLRDPAIGARLGDLCRDQLGRTLQEAQRLIEAGAVVTEEDLSRAAAGAGGQLASWRERLPPLGMLGARDVVDVVLSTERDIDAGT